MAPGKTLEGLRIAGVGRQSRGNDDSLSIEDQIARMEGATDHGGGQLVRTFAEKDVSGGRPLNRRPGLLQAVELIEAGQADVLMVAYFDRLVRSLKTQAEVVERVEAAGGRVVALDVGEISNGSAAAWLSGQTIGMMSEYQRRSSGERTHDAKQRAIDRGVPPFPSITPAYRRREDGTLELDPVNAPIMREAAALRLGGMSWTNLTRWLIEQGVPVTPSSVIAIFSSRLLVGEIHFGKFKPNLHAIEQPLLDQATFRRLNAARATKGRRAKSERLLARQQVLHCATCGARMSVAHTGRMKYAYYRCGNRLCPQQASIRADAVEDYVRDEAIRLSAEIVGSASAEAEVEAARLAREDAEQRYANAIRTLAGRDDVAATAEVLDELQAARDVAAAEHDRLSSLTGPDVTVTTAEDWHLLTLDERRAVIRATIARATVTPGRGPGRIRIEPRGE